MDSPKENGSPHWNSSVKLVIALVIVTVIIALTVRFKNLIGPLLLAFLLAYLLHPVAQTISRKTHMGWGLTLILMYIVLIAVLVGLLTWGGLTIFGQAQSFIDFLQRTINSLPQIIENFTAQKIMIGPFEIDLSQYKISDVVNTVLGSIEPILSNLGSTIASIASGAAEIIGWIVFIGMVSFFIQLETKGKTGQLMTFEVPGYEADIRKIETELGKIWNTFLRGQMIVILITNVVYFILMKILGTNFAFGIAILAGMARFVPYVGPTVAWTVLALVSYFQPGNLFGMSQLAFAIMNVAVAMITDFFLDNFVATRLFAKTLKIHPAAVLIMAFVGANLIGVIGVVLASPVMASLKLFWHYTLRKLFDLDPWEDFYKEEEPDPLPTWMVWLQDKAVAFYERLFKKNKQKQMKKME